MNARRECAVLARLAFVDSVPVLVGYVTMGFVAGVLLAAKGGVTMAPLWAFLSSICTVSGTFSFAFVLPVSEHASLWSIALLTAGINFRYLFYGISFIERWRGLPLARKWFLVHMLTDETYALESSCVIVNRGRAVTYCLLLSAFNITYWVVSATLGAFCVVLLRRALDPEVVQTYTRGVEFAMVALYIVVFTDQIREYIHHAK